MPRRGEETAFLARRLSAAAYKKHTFSHPLVRAQLLQGRSASWVLLGLAGEV